MTYVPKITFPDFIIDAFGRLRVSEVFTQMDIKQLESALPLLIDNVGTGSVSTSLPETTITAAAGQYQIARTKTRGVYQSGKSQQIYMTTRSFNTTVGDVRYGYFSTASVVPYDSYDGIMLRSSAGTIYAETHRSGVVTSSVARANWADPLDGTGYSGINYDFDKNTILEIDFEWLGYGRVKFSLVHQGGKVPFHAVDFTNGSSYLSSTGDWVVIDSAFTGPYMSSPNQPLCWEVRNGESLVFTCAAVGSEGAINQLGKSTAINTGITAISMALTGAKYVLLAVRKKKDFNLATIEFTGISLLSASNDDLLWELHYNPTYTETATYTLVTNSALAYAVGNGARQVLTDGYIIASGYAKTGTASTSAIDTLIKLGESIAGVSDEIALVIKPLTSNASAAAAINFKEIL